MCRDIVKCQSSESATIVYKRTDLYKTLKTPKKPSNPVIILMWFTKRPYFVNVSAGPIVRFPPDSAASQLTHSLNY